MKTIQVMGPGCPKCQKLAENAKEAAETLGIEYELVKITDIKEMMQYGVMTTPSLAVDGVVKAVGKVSSVDEIKAFLS